MDWEVKGIVDPFGHSWKCTSPDCEYGFCQEIKKLMINSKGCRHSIFASNNCETCEEVIYFLGQHCNDCKEDECDICCCKNNVNGKQLSVRGHLAFENIDIQRQLDMKNIHDDVARCNICAHDVKTGQDWYCIVCPNFDVCNSCYLKQGVFIHPHKLATQNEEAQYKLDLKVKTILCLLVHATKCPSGEQCQSSYCRKMKLLFHHTSLCKNHAPSGCSDCKKTWHILQLHAETCKETGCRAPRCKDLKEYLGF